MRYLLKSVKHITEYSGMVMAWIGLGPSQWRFQTSSCVPIVKAQFSIYSIETSQDKLLVRKVECFVATPLFPFW